MNWAQNTRLFWKRKYNFENDISDVCFLVFTVVRMALLLQITWKFTRHEIQNLSWVHLTWFIYANLKWSAWTQTSHLSIAYQATPSPTTSPAIPAAATFVSVAKAAIVSWPNAASDLRHGLLDVIRDVAGFRDGVREFHLCFNLSHCCCLAVVAGDGRQ